MSFARLLLYTFSGFFAALLGWSIGQFLWIDLFALLGINAVPSYLILTVVTPCIAVAMVATEVFLSNPTRHKANWTVLKRTYLPLVTILGVISGAILSALNWQLLSSNWSSTYVRLLSWGLIGLFTGLAESLSWRFRSVEGAGKRARNRIIQSVVFGLLAGLVAATIYETVRHSFGRFQEPVGFVGLGLLIGCVLSVASRPSYQVALRAGQGFENIQLEESFQNIQMECGLFSRLNHERFAASELSFVPLIDDRKEPTRIEEGLSIKLPTSARQGKPIVVGSGENADIFIPNIPKTCALLWTEPNGFKIKCESTRSFKIQNKLLLAGDIATLRHNQILSFYDETDPTEFYRFIFYDRLLDPQA